MYVYPKLKEARKLAKQKGLPKPYTSQYKDKKLYVVYDGEIIHFGDRNYEDFLMHKDKDRRDRYRARAEKILLKDNTPAYLDPTKPAYYSYNLLW